MERRVLVTGASGFIGAEAVLHLNRAGWNVVGSGRSGRGGFIKVDLEDPKLASELLKGPRMDAIVHLGAKVGWRGETLDQLFIPNVVGTANLLLVAKRWDAHFIFASAAVVCGVATEQITSASELQPDVPYSKSKWLAEQLIEAAGVRAAILRLAGVFGAAGPDHLGLNRAIARAIRGEPPKLVGNGEAKRNYVYVKDVARDIVYALERGVEGAHLIAGSEVSTITEMLAAICSVFLPGAAPEKVNGPSARNQVVERSPLLPPARSFREALLDIRGAMQ